MCGTFHGKGRSFITQNLGNTYLIKAIEDIWTKPTGRVEAGEGGGFGWGGVEGWGENADNCN